MTEPDQSRQSVSGAPVRSLGELAPRHDYDRSLVKGANPFARFRDLDDDAWLELLLRSLEERVIDDVEFPGFPQPELQSLIHGSSGEVGIREAHGFYRFCRDHTYGDVAGGKGLRFLDFASGWGRITRPFLRDFRITDIYGYEPNLLFCTIARALNPYACYIHGQNQAAEWLPQAWFDVVVGWSIFSHLGEESARGWLGEINRAMRPGGWCVFTTWGDRFLNRLQAEKKLLDEGGEIHWYSELCIGTAGDLDARLAEYNEGEFVYFSQSDPNYGEAFISEDALKRILSEEGLDFEVVHFDKSTMGQDAFVLRRPS